MNDELLEVLTATRNSLTKKTWWGFGQPCSNERVCAIQALGKICSDQRQHIYFKILNDLNKMSQKYYGKTLVWVNDKEGLNQVHRVFDALIKRYEKLS